MASDKVQYCIDCKRHRILRNGDWDDWTTYIGYAFKRVEVTVCKECQWARAVGLSLHKETGNAT